MVPEWEESAATDAMATDRTSQMAGFSVRKPILPFLSSTQEDFLEERKFLADKIFPQIDVACKERGTYFSPTNLQWKPTDPHVADGHALRLSLDLITKSSPFYICMIGERYGQYRSVESPPLPRTIQGLENDADWLDWNLMVAASAGHKWVLGDSHQHCSMLELEIMQAAFLNDSDHCLFYFRQPEHLDDKFTELSEQRREKKIRRYLAEDEECRLLVRDLKQRIVKKGLAVKYFRTLAELGHVVLADWIYVLDMLFPPLPDSLGIFATEEISDWVSLKRFVETRQSVYLRTSDINEVMAKLSEFAVSCLDDPLADDTSPVRKHRAFSVTSILKKKTEDERKYKSILTLTGERGSGKSTIIANWIQKFTHDNPEVKIMTVYVGANAHSTDISVYMRKCSKEMRKQYLLKSPNGILDKLGNEAGTFVEVCEAFIAAVSLGPCVLVIDGVDELGGTLGCSSQQIKKLDWLPQPLPTQCRVVLTCVQSDFAFKSLTARPDVHFVTMPTLSTIAQCSSYLEERMPLTFDHIKRRHLLKIWECNSKLKTRPLFLSLLANELRCYNVFSDLDNYLEKLSEVVGIREFWTKCLQRWIMNHSWTYDHVSSLTDTSTIAGSEGVAMVGWVADALRLIAVSRNGLSQSELLTLLKRIAYCQDSEVSEFDWLFFRECVGDSLFEGPSGLLNFSHQHLKESVEYALLSSVKPVNGTVFSLSEPQREWQKDKETFHQHLADYFLKQPHSQRRVDELPWQLLMARDSKKLYKVLANPMTFLAMTDEQSHWPSNKLDLRFYWSILKTAGCEPRDAYLQMLSEIGIIELNEKAVDVSLTSIGLNQSAIGLPVGMPTIVTIPASEKETDVTSDELIDLESVDVSYSTQPCDHDDTQPVAMEMKWMSNEESTDVIPPVLHSTLTMQDEEEDLSKHRQMALSIAWNVAVFLIELDEMDTVESVLAAVHNYLLTHCPLSQDEQFLQSRVEEKLGAVCSGRGDITMAERWYKLATKTLVDISDTDDDDNNELNLKILHLKGKLLTHHAQIRMQDGRQDDAEDFYLEAQDCLNVCHDIIGKSTVLHNLAILKIQQGDYLRAESLLREALICRRRWFGQYNSVVADTIFSLATLMSLPQNTRGYNKLSAEFLYRQALEIREKCLSENHPMVASTLYHLGKLLQGEAGQASKNEAVRLLRRALDIRTTHLGDTHPDTKQVRVCLHGLEVSLQLGQYEFGPAKPVDTRTVERPYSGLSWRDKELTLLQRKVRSQRSASRSLRPQSAIGSVSTTFVSSGGMLGGSKRQSFRTQSSPTERLLLELDRPNSRLLKRGTVVNGHYGNGNMKTLGRLPHHDSSSKLSIADSVDSGSSKSAVDRLGGTKNNKPVRVEIPLSTKTLTSENDNDESIEGSVDERNFSPSSDKGDNTRLVRPVSGPVHLYKRYSSAGSQSASAKVGRANRARSAVEARRRIDSGRSSQMTVHTGLSSYSAFSAQSHKSRCTIPGPHSINPSRTYSLGGPNSSVVSLLSAPCPRDVTRPVYHKSAWYHIPGRYVTLKEPIPRKRSQTRLNSATKSSMALKTTGLNSQGEITDRSYQDLTVMDDVDVANSLFLTEDTGLSPSPPHGGATVTFKEAVIIG